MDDLKTRLQQAVLVIDGAMGTQLQKAGLTPADFGGPGQEGCNEYLNVSRPDVVDKVHCDYLIAGADIIETNTFGANSVVLAEYGLQARAAELNLAAARLARRCADRHSLSSKPRFVAGSMGPTTKAITVTGGITFDALRAAYAEQAAALIEGGADFLLLETAQDLMNLKAGLEGIADARKKTAVNIPAAVSASFGAGSTMLSGQDVAAYCVSLAHYPLFAMGINCAAGPDEIKEGLETLSSLSRFPVLVMPNAGLPDENGHYGETPETFAKKVSAFARQGLVNIVGGCCGTSPAHIRALSHSVRNVPVRRLPARRRWAVSGTHAVFADRIKAPIIAGERCNSIGSKLFREMVAREDWDQAVAVAKKQAKAGAHLLDVCLANPERDELADVKVFIEKVASAVRQPLMIDTTNPAVAEAAMKLCPGTVIWNSVNFEHGEERMLAAASLNRRYGAKLVVGCIDEDKSEGMAVTAIRKLEIATRAYRFLCEKCAVPEEDVIFDALVFPSASGQGKYSKAAAETAEGIRLIKQNFPACKTILGVSNVSFGLPVPAREALNSVFLHMCVEAGLDIAIANAEKLLPYESLPDNSRELGRALLTCADDNAVAAFTALFREQKKTLRPAQALKPEERLYQLVLDGIRDGVAAATEELAGTWKPVDIINGPLSKAMAEVGVRFASGELIVTEVLQSAEAMKAAMNVLEPRMKAENSASRGKMLLATVAGDVHDIGKNLVHIIFQSNGFEVVDMGVKVPNADIVSRAVELKPDVIGLSGLLTRSAETMITVAEDLEKAGVSAPLVVGGAALSAKFVNTRLAPQRPSGRVLYARDAMEGLAQALSAMKDGK